MVGIDFIDTIVVRRSVEKGTRIIQERAKKITFAGDEFKKYQKERKKVVGDIGLASSKGTRLVRLGKLVETQIPSTSGLHMSTGRGTGVRIG